MAGRADRGQALAEGAVAMICIAALIVGGILLLMGAGSAFYYKLKIAHAAETGARFGTDKAEFLGAPRPNYTDSQLEQDVIDVVNTSLNVMGLPEAKSIEVARETIKGKRFLKVKVKVDGLPILSGGILPNAISVDDTAASAFSDNSPPGVLGLTLGTSPTGKGYYVPIYGPGSGFPAGLPTTFPRGKVFYYAAGVQADASNVPADVSILDIP